MPGQKLILRTMGSHAELKQVISVVRFALKKQL